jgi:hypothetical protein
MRIAGYIGAFTGTAALALRFLQRQHASAAGYRTERAPGNPADDDKTWSGIESRISFGVVRDSGTLPKYLARQVERCLVYRGQEFRGWFSLLISPMRNHSYFGDLKVATLIDLAAAHSSDLAPFAILAANQAKAARCDLIVSNQMQTEALEALRAAGFLSHGSNYLMASSIALSAIMVDESSFVTRQDGDGLVNLHSPPPL